MKLSGFPRRREIGWLLVGLSLIILSGCQNKNELPVSDKIKVVVSITPQLELVERIGGSAVEVRALVGPGQSPETFDPTPTEMTFLAEADVYFRLGLSFESIRFGRLKESMPNLLAVNTHDGIKRRAIESHENHDHLSEALADPHIWLSPDHLKTQAESICQTLSSLRAEQAAEFESNLNSLKAELDSVKAYVTNLLAPYAGESIYVFHPSFGYFTDQFSLTQIPIEIAGHEPGSAYLAELISRMKSNNVSAIMIQPQFDSHLAANIARETGAELITLDPLARDNIANLTRIGQSIAGSLSHQNSREAAQ